MQESSDSRCRGIVSSGTPSTQPPGWSRMANVSAPNRQPLSRQPRSLNEGLNRSIRRPGCFVAVAVTGDRPNCRLQLDN